MKTGLSLMLCLGALLGFRFPLLGHPHCVDPGPAIRVRVTNYAPQASPRLLGRAEREAGRILAEAGLRIIWVNCPMIDSFSSVRDPCREPLEATDVVLRVLPEVNKAKFQDAQFGFAVVPILASVYYEKVMQLAMSDEAMLILGCVIAHELGHLLPGSDSHSRTGIMQSRWDRKQVHQAATGRLLFGEEESRRMRSEVIARAELHEPHR